MDNNKILYQLTVEDFQNVAMEILDRELTADEIKKIADRVADNIPWYDLIANGISEFIEYQEGINDTDD
jgi:hypothetical protein